VLSRGKRQQHQAPTFPVERGRSPTIRSGLFMLLEEPLVA
jgi:hypothetical protein